MTTTRSALRALNGTCPALRAPWFSLIPLALLGPLSGCGGDDASLLRSDAGADGGADATLTDASDARARDADGAASDGTAGDGAAGDGATAPFEAPFYLGADLTFTQQDEAAGLTFADTDGTPKPILQLMKDHGFNYVRLRTFVDPTQRSPDPTKDGGTNPPYSAAGFGDLAHTVEFGQRIKAAGMGFLLDFHYSDYWADPGKQIKPATWAGDDLPAAVAHLHDYTFDAIRTLVDAGARPDMVQIGNEITPGMLLTPGTPLGARYPNDWPSLAQLLKAGIQAVHEVDPTIKIMLHLDRGGDLPNSIDFIDKALENGVSFDVFGESCYVSYQGPPSSWQNTFNELVTRYPNLKFVMAEYNTDPANPKNDELRQANDIVFQLPNHQGLGTFFWEPTRRINTENPGMFTTSGNVSKPIPECMAQYDRMRLDYGL